MIETLNMMEIPVDKFINEIKMDLEDDNYDPVIGIGKSGVGKTMSIYELTQELGIGFCELRLVTMTEIDILGIPKEDVNGRTTYAANSLLPDEARDGESGILVLDEITSATATVRAAAYQLLDSKRALGEYKLPKKWKVVALGNGPSDGGVFQGVEAAFLSRATCYRIEPNLDSWKKWAINKGVNPSIIAYLTFDPSKLHEMDVDEIASIFPCPRSWTALSQKLNAREKRAGGLLPLEQVELYAAGAVGMRVAPSFAAFYAYNSKTLSPEDILSGKAKADVVNTLESEVIYLMIQSLIKQLKVEIEQGKKPGYCEFTTECVQRSANLLNWLIDVADYKLDYAVTALTDIAAGIKDFCTMVLMCDELDQACPRFIKFANDIGIAFKAQA